MTPCLPQWDLNTIEATSFEVSDISTSWQTCSHKKKASVALMTWILNTCDPKYYADAKGKLEWEKTMWHEIDSLEKNHTWDLVPWPTGKNVVKFRWVYHTKFTPDGAIEHHRAHLVVKGFSQQEGIDYIDIFSPIEKMNSI